MARTTDRFYRGCAIGVALFVLGCLFPESTSAQNPEAEWNRLNKAVVEAYRAGNYADGVHRAEEALAIARAAFGERDERTLTSLNNLGGLYQAQGRYGEAEPLYTQALQIRRETLGPTHPETLTSLNNLASLYQAQGRYGEAEPLYTQAWSGAQAALGPAHPNTLLFHLNSTGNLAAQGRWDAAVERLRQMEPQALTWLGTELYSTEAADVRRQLVWTQSTYQDLAISLALIADGGPPARELGASAVLRFKGLLAEEEAYLAAIVRRGKDPEAARLAKEIAELRAVLARTFHSGADAAKVKTLQQQLDAKELALGRISRAYEQHLQVRNANLDDLRASLPRGTGLLEFRRYRPVDFRQGTLGEPRYAGVLIKGFDTLRVVDLGPVAPTDEDVLAGRIVFQVRGTGEKDGGLRPVVLTHMGRALTDEQEREGGKWHA